MTNTYPARRLAAVLAIAMLGGGVLGALATLAIGHFQQPIPEPTVLREVEILEVRQPEYATTPHTLVEYSDGRRAVLRAYYGPPGDTFMMSQPVQQGER